MPRLVHQVPKYRKHRASGQAIVTISGKDHYLGPHGTKASHALYDRLVAEFLSAGRQVVEPARAESISVVEVLAAFWRHCKNYYVKEGKPTNEQDAFRIIIRDVRHLYGKTATSDFGPKALKAVRQRWQDRGQSRPTINKNMRRLTRIFRWAASEELIPVTIPQALATVPGLKKGRTTAPEPPPILPVEMPIVQRTIPHMPAIVQAMVRIQLLTGMRPGEICKLRPVDVERGADVWEYRPRSHKTEHHGRARVVYIGPEAQAILTPYLLRDAKVPCFSPAESMSAYLAAKHAERKTPMSCGNRPGSNRKAKPKKLPADQYDPSSYRRAIHRACDIAFPPPKSLAQREGETEKQYLARLTEAQQIQLAKWQSDQRWSPNQLRHAAATEIRKKFGLEAAQVILGHAAADVTQVYAERDADKARAVVRQIG
jgi:integrase